MDLKYDFSGWATRNHLVRADGRTIREEFGSDQRRFIIGMVKADTFAAPDDDFLLDTLAMGQIHEVDKGMTTPTKLIKPKEETTP